MGLTPTLGLERGLVTGWNGVHDGHGVLLAPGPERELRQGPQGPVLAPLVLRPKMWPEVPQWELGAALGLA